MSYTVCVPQFLDKKDTIITDLIIFNYKAFVTYEQYFAEEDATNVRYSFVNRALLSKN